MIYKRFLINEIEKKEILKQYNIITEAVDPTPVSSLVIDKVVKFPAGRWKETYLEPLLKPEIDKITEYLKNSAGKIFVVSVSIEAWESKIPNVDAEVTPNKPLKPTDLAKLRNETIQKYITKQLQSFVNERLLIELPAFKVAQPKIGPTDWVGTPFCPKGSTEEQQRNECVLNYRKGKTTKYQDYAKNYDNEQRINIYIKLEELTGMKKCLDNMTIQVNYTDLSKNHTCNSAIYEIYLNGIKLFRDDGKPYASLNNNGNKVKQYPGLDKYDNDFFKVGGKRYNTFIVTPEIASEVLVKSMSKLPKDQKPSFTLSARCVNPLGNNDAKWGDGCHEGVGNIVITNGQKQVFTYASSTPNAKNEIKTLVTFDACGSGISQ
jgi:hypothetical protein